MSKILCQGCEEQIEYKDAYRCEICEEKFCEFCFAESDDSTICPSCQQEMRKACSYEGYSL